MFMGAEFPFGEVKKVLEIEGGGSCTTMYLLHLEMVKVINFMLFMFYHNKKFEKSKLKNAPKVNE